MRQHPQSRVPTGPAGIRHPHEPTWRATSPAYQRRSLRPYRCLGSRRPAGDRGRNGAAQPTDGNVALVGYSLGALRVGRALDAVEYPEIVQRVSRVAFLSPIFGGPTEETPPAGGFVTFPLSLTERNAERDAVCAGHRVEGGTDYAWAQLMDHDVVGRRWGGTDPAHPAGVLRSPTFSAYGWNADVAAQLIPPTLVMQGIDDTDIPGGTGNAPAIYHARASVYSCLGHPLRWSARSAMGRPAFHDQGRADRVDHQRNLRWSRYRHVRR